MIKILKMKNTWHSENPLQIHGGFLKIHHLLLSQGWKIVLIELLAIFYFFSMVGSEKQIERCLKRVLRVKTRLFFYGNQISAFQPTRNEHPFIHTLWVIRQ